ERDAGRRVRGCHGRCGLDARRLVRLCRRGRWPRPRRPAGEQAGQETRGGEHDITLDPILPARNTRGASGVRARELARATRGRARAPGGATAYVVPAADPGREGGSNAPGRAPTVGRSGGRGLESTRVTSRARRWWRISPASSTKPRDDGPRTSFGPFGEFSDH